MCFKNLPIEFDATGRAFLRPEVRNPYAYEATPIATEEERIEELLRRNGHIKAVDFDPVTRVAGALAFHAVADLKERRVLSAASMATLFRGYEVIMKGRDPRDALFITSRACGVCGGVHATTAALAMEMAIGVVPPPLGIVMRNLLLALEFLYDHPLHLFLLAGPDYSQAIVSTTNPELWERAQHTEAPRGHLHGYRTIGDMMVDLNPLTGKLYLEALHMTRVAREAYVLIGGKYPHPETVVPGGMSVTVSLSTFNQIYVRLQQFFDYAKKVVPFWDDLVEFFYGADPRYRQVGARPATLIDPGIWDDPEAYDATYTNCNAWGQRRWATPGVIVDGEVVTTELQAMNIGIEEFVEHSYYEPWDGQRFPVDPAGNPLSPHHMWNRDTKPKPVGQSWKEKYSWATSPRWDRRVMEAECTARMWLTAAARKLPTSTFIEPTGRSLVLRLPAGARPETVMAWKIPDVWNAFERNRGRAYCIPYTALVAMDNWLRGLDYLKKGETRVSSRFAIPRRGQRIGAGFWGAGRGYLTHHLVLENGTVANYQILTPSTWNASPKDPWGHGGAYEEAVLNTPILETFSGPDDFKGIDILRTIRSFDPCMPCTTHIAVADANRVITREVNTCACEVDG
ncbi:MAG: nickel-dependent hydrogenase large subunit [Armatimonadota bacterium]|nr:nickel-dependent hydrogenase large subunit [Armatimonadota bacterium]MDR7486743.1 nickel-dependent hydrogenase large subunit [Armatimonadota bacterium]MDR7534277.1 nickel-dependent hydrogenase large subunit [Armatimonadota bacterium]MDR7535372.1 nickel-dependent hydrogenase large subunit [Armatimonadota bacterium]